MAEQSDCFCLECRPDLYHSLYSSPKYAESYADYFNESFQQSDEVFLQPHTEMHLLNQTKFGYTNKGFYI